MPKAHNCKFDWNPAGGGGSKFACDSYNTLDHSCIRLIPLCIFAAFQRSALKTYGYRWRDDRKQISCVSHLSDDAIDFKIWLAGLYLFFGRWWASSRRSCPRWWWTSADRRTSEGRIENRHRSRNVTVHLATLEEFVQRHDTILVFVHFLHCFLHKYTAQCDDFIIYLKNFIDFFLNSVLFDARLGQLAHKFVYGSDNVGHFFFRDAAVPVDVIQCECPAKLLLQWTTREDG